MSKQHRKAPLNCQKSVPFIVVMTLVKARDRKGKDGYIHFFLHILKGDRIILIVYSNMVVQLNRRVISE
jgi:hypothetical protein